MISAAGLRKRFGARCALDGIDIEVGAGERVGFLGRNGAGKTTLLRIFAAYLSPDGGTCQVAGVDVLRDPTRAQRAIGFLAEDAPAYPEMRALDFLRMRAELKGAARGARSQALGRLELVGLADRARSTVGSLSRGMRQRLGLADALLGDPKLLILDEPTSGLDPAQLGDLISRVGELAADRALVFASHRLDAVRSLCERLVVIARGRVVFDGTADALAGIGDGDLDAAFLKLTSEEDL